MTFANTEAGGGGGAWWGRLRWRYWEADSRYEWKEGGKFIYRDCRCEVASVRLSHMSEKATLREWCVLCRGVGFEVCLLFRAWILSSSEIRNPSKIQIRYWNKEEATSK